MSTWITREKMAPRTLDSLIGLRLERQRVLRLLPVTGHNKSNLRRFYRDRPLTELAARCLRNEALRSKKRKDL